MLNGDPSPMTPNVICNEDSRIQKQHSPFCDIFIFSACRNWYPFRKTFHFQHSTLQGRFIIPRLRGGATPSENPYNSCVNHHICPKDFLRVSLFYPRIPKYRRLKLFCPSPFATLGIIFAPLWLKIQKYPQPMKTLENIEFWWVEKIGQV